MDGIKKAHPELKDEAVIELRNSASVGWKISVAREFYGLLSDTVEQLFYDGQITDKNGEKIELMDELEKAEDAAKSQVDEDALNERKMTVFGAPRGTNATEIKRWVVAAMLKTLTKSETKINSDGLQKRRFKKPVSFEESQVTVETADLPDRMRAGRQIKGSYVAFIIMPSKEWTKIPGSILKLENCPKGVILQKYKSNNKKVNQNSQNNAYATTFKQANKPDTNVNSRPDFGMADGAGASSSAFSSSSAQPRLEEMESRLQETMDMKLNLLNAKMTQFDLLSAKKTEVASQVTDLVDTKLSGFTEQMRALYANLKEEMDKVATELGTAAQQIHLLATDLTNPMTKQQKKDRIAALVAMDVSADVAAKIVQAEIVRLQERDLGTKEKLTALAVTVASGQDKVNKITDASKATMEQIEEAVLQAQEKKEDTVAKKLLMDSNSPGKRKETAENAQSHAVPSPKKKGRMEDKAEAEKKEISGMEQEL